MSEAKQAELTDRDLVSAIARGDAEALRALNTRYGRKIVALAMRFVGNESEAEEIAADVMWQAWREAQSYEPARGSVLVWLVTIARSRSIDRLRSIKARSVVRDESSSLDPIPDPASNVGLAERARAVRGALTKLDENERAALEMAYFSDLSQSQVAEKLGVPLGTVKTRIRSAMIKLRKALSELRG